MVFGACTTPRTNESYRTRPVRPGAAGGPFARTPSSGADPGAREAALAPAQDQPSAREEVRCSGRPLGVGHLRVVHVSPALPHRATRGPAAFGEPGRDEQVDDGRVVGQPHV